MPYEILIMGFIVVQILVVGFIVIWLKTSLVSSTEGAVTRLNDEIAKANEQQADLSKRLREADEELNRRRSEAKALTDRMKTDAEVQTKEERSKIILEARKEGEEIISKAQNAKSRIREELEKEIDVKVIHVGMKIVNDVLSQKAKGALHDVLIDEFIAKLKEISMDRINRDIDAVDVISIKSLDEAKRSQLSGIIMEKMGKEPKMNFSTDDKIGGGIILKFGSLALDGSIRNLIRESAINFQEEVEARKA